jgi:hypothetical protein
MIVIFIEKSLYYVRLIIQNVIELIPDIRKYFSFNSIKAVGEPHRIKRPWLSIIKQITKLKYTISANDHRIKMGNKVVRSISYNIIPLIKKI